VASSCVRNQVVGTGASAVYKEREHCLRSVTHANTGLQMKQLLRLVVPTLRTVCSKQVRSVRPSLAIGARSFTNSSDRDTDRNTELVGWNVDFNNPDSNLLPASLLTSCYPFYRLRIPSSSWWNNEEIPWITLNESGRMWSPRVDIHKTKDAMVIDAELPGMSKKDIKMKIKDGFLELSGERKVEKTDEDKDRNWKRIERSYGSFLRRVKLPHGADIKEIKACFDKGILKVTVPHPAKEEEAHEVEIHEPSESKESKELKKHKQQ